MKNSKVLGFILVMLSAIGCQTAQTGSTLETPSNKQEDVFEYKGKIYKENELPDKLKLSLYEAKRRYIGLVEDAVNAYIKDNYIVEKVKQTGKSKAAVEADLLDLKPVTDAEVKKYYETNKAKIPYSFEKSKAELKKIMTTERAFAHQREAIEKIKRETGFKLLIAGASEPTVKIDTKGYPTKWNPNAKITVIEFADFRCPHCREAFDTLPQLASKYKDSVKFVFMHYPLSEEPGPSHLIAQGSFCAMKKDKFWDYHDWAFQNQGMISREEILNFAAKHGMNRAEFSSCLTSKEALAHVNQSRDIAENAGVGLTPTFFVNGKRVLPDLSLTSLSTAIDKAQKGQ